MFFNLVEQTFSKHFENNEVDTHRTSDFIYGKFTNPLIHVLMKKTEIKRYTSGDYLPRTVAGGTHVHPVVSS